MDEKTLIKLLQLQFEHERKLREFAGKLNLNYLEIDLLSVVLDAVGVPADNTLDQIEKYGYAGWLDQPDTVSRAWYYDEFQRQVAHGTYEEAQAYLESVMVTSAFQYMLNSHKIEMAFVAA
ncbi:MAG: hypothetical protein KJ077_12135 [Anaerolineae bacterium]|nr:hypothetical protein [Anaerolineae bacterium]